MNIRKILKKGNNGITLIALVITIIVLLILAGVSIATLTGDNGILTQTSKAKEETTKESAKEKVKLEVIGSYGTNGNLDNSLLKTNLNNIQGIQGVPDTIEDSSFPLTVTVDGVKIDIRKDGTVEYAFNVEEWDKTATPEDCFIWGSDNKGEEGYDVVVGYTQKIGNNTKLKFPSRCTKIDLSSSYTNTANESSRSFCSSIKTIELPNTVVNIGSWAFAGGGYESSLYGFDALESITLPKNVTSIGRNAFYSCESLKSIEIPSSVTSIESWAFAYCTSLSSITIPDGVTRIENGAFYSCKNLKSIEIPSSVTTIENYAFPEWTSSQTINIQGYTSAPLGWGSYWNGNCLATINWGQ